MQMVKNINNKEFTNRAATSVGTIFGGGYAHGIRPIPNRVFGQWEVRDCFDGGVTYQTLTFAGKRVDTNNPATLGHHKQFLMQAHGSLLVSGVGLGGFLYRLLRKPNVDYVTVVEPNLSLINLIEPAFADYMNKLTFVNCRPSDIVNAHVYDGVYHYRK